MPNPGYLYVLVNSSMPGLVKVGKTSRSPAERAQELSGATGVPVPFLVAYEQFFADCDTAEDFVHDDPERRGFRMAPNREFFRAPVNEVIRAVMRAPGQAELSSLYTTEAQDGELLSASAKDADGFGLEPYRRTNPWDDLLEEAEDYLYGTGDKVEDPREAIRLYKQAAKLGSLLAWQRLGDVYEYGTEGIRDNRDLAIQYYREGAKKVIIIVSRGCL